MRLNKLAIKDKKIFNKYLTRNEHELSVFAFENIYIWKKHFNIFWAIIGDSLCIFFKDSVGCFLYLPPLGKSNKPGVIKEAFEIMNKYNENKELSRIENVEEKDLAFYKKIGYECVEKSCDYICKTSDMIQLKGDKFRRKRAAYNYFVKNYKHEYLPFSLKYKNDCLKLYDAWMKNRKTTNQDAIYQGMLEDSKISLKVLLDSYKDLDLIGRIVKVGGKVKAFTFGFSLNKDMFCVIYETTDLSIKGLSQFIFREFCRESKKYKYINIMDDSGLENLKRVKLSYHPIKSAKAYIIKE